MDVVIVSNSVSIARGGAPRQVRLLANALQEEGRQVAVVTKEDDPLSTGLHDRVKYVAWRTQGTKRGWRSRLFGFVRDLLGGGRAGRCMSRLQRHVVQAEPRRWLARIEVAEDARKVRKVLQRLRPVVVVAFMPNVAALVALARARQSFRMLASFRSDPGRMGLDFPWFELMSFVGRRADVVTANSSGALDALAARPEFSRSTLRLSPNILESFPESPAGDRKRFIVVAFLNAAKRVDIALHAFRETDLASQGWELLIVGDGSERDSLERMATTLGLSSACRFLGHVERPAEVLAEGGVLLQLSEAEGMPNAVMEAMSHGLPFVVTGGSPGPRELAESVLGRAGLVVPVGDVAATARAMLELARSPELRRRLSDTGRLAAERMLWKYLAPVWHDLIGAAPQGPLTGLATLPRR